MNFFLTDFKRLLACTKNSSLKYLNIQIRQKQLSVTISRETSKKLETNIQSLQSNQLLAFTHKQQYVKNKFTNIQHNSDEKIEYFTIVSPMVGTFYRTPSPGEPYFIKINDNVQINQTVCIIEAMKLMNEIKAEIEGIIVEILVKDGDIVDCGQALMKVKASKL